MSPRTLASLVLVSMLVLSQAGPAAAAATDRGAVGTGGAAAGHALEDPESFEAWLDGVMASSMAAHDVPGATVAVVKDGETFLAKGYGEADVASGRPVEADRTLFRIGSVSKLVTWTAVMQGVERDRLSLSTDVNRYLDDSPVTVPERYGEPVTLEHLGTHTAGFEEELAGTLVPGESDVRPLGPMLEANRPARVRPPGELPAYSNWGAALAGHVVAERANTTFDRYVEREVFEPIGMGSSTFRQPVGSDLRSRLAEGYLHRGGVYDRGEFEYVGVPPAGSMSATATDMAAFMNAHLGNGSHDGGRILDPGSVRSMHERHYTTVEGLDGMAYGFYEMDENGHEVIGHGGDTQLFHSLVFLLPERDVGVFVSYNAPGGVPARGELFEAFMDRYYPAPDDGPATADAGDLGRFTGDYRTTRIPYTSWLKAVGLASTFQVSRGPNGTLVTSRLGGGAQRWRPVGDRTFEAVDGDRTLAFRTEGGRASVLFFDDSPFVAYPRVGAAGDPVLNLALAGVALLVALSTVILYVGTVAWRRYRDRPADGRRPTVARAVLALYALLVLVLAGSVLVGLGDLVALVAGGSPVLAVVAAVPVALVVLAATAVAFAGLAWRDGYWTLPGRVHYTLVTAVAVAFVVQLGYWEFLPV
jgi:CubicO group peptidase (beta-lactamase class C family)